MKKILVVFDFDHTIIDANSDTHIFKLGRNEEIPDELLRSMKSTEWIDFMARVFSYLHSECNVGRSDYESCLAEIPLTQGMEQLFVWLRANQDHVDTVIISDANSFFINHILSTYGIADVVKEVYTNPATFTSPHASSHTSSHTLPHTSSPHTAELLTIKGCHHQDWCELSSPNICKGFLLEQILGRRQRVETEENGAAIQGEGGGGNGVGMENGVGGREGGAQGSGLPGGESVEYDVVVYVGDGKNDLCPSLKLTATDYVCARNDFSLLKCVRKWDQKHQHQPERCLQATLLVWETADIITVLLKRLLEGRGIPQAEIH